MKEQCQHQIFTLIQNSRRYAEEVEPDVLCGQCSSLSSANTPMFSSRETFRCSTIQLLHYQSATV